MKNYDNISLYLLVDGGSVHVVPRKMQTNFCWNCEESGRKASKAATEEEKNKSNPGS